MIKGKKVAILQSNYIPWKGYFDLINMSDEFILFDDMQYTRRDWRNRNRISTPTGLKWLTVPVEVKGKYFQKIKDTKIHGADWPKSHWAQIKHNYSKSTYFKDYKEIFEPLYLSSVEKNKYLSEVNYKFIITINEILGIKTKIRWSDEFDLVEGKTERLLGICKDCNASDYISGPAAKDYFDISLARNYNINVCWMDYSNYPEYKQLNEPFEHGISIIDLIFNEGPNAKKFMKSFKK